MEANSKLFSKILLYHYSATWAIKLKILAKMGTSRIFVMMIRNELTYPSRPQAMCTFFIVLHIREKKRENLGSMVISWLSLRIFPAFFAFNRKWATKTRVQVLLAMLCAFYEKNMGLSLLPHLLHTFTPNWTKPSVLWWWSLQRREAFLPPSSTLK